MVHGRSSPSEILDRIRAGTRPSIPAGYKGRHPGLEAALVRALALDPKERFPDMASFAAALAAPESAPPEPAPATRELSAAADPMLTSQASFSREEMVEQARRARARVGDTGLPDTTAPPAPGGAPKGMPGEDEALRAAAKAGSGPPRQPSAATARPAGTRPAGAALPWARIAVGCALVAVVLGLGLGPGPAAGPATARPRRPRRPAPGPTPRGPCSTGGGASCRRSTSWPGDTGSRTAWPG
jgi:hypothetical protein